MAPPKFFSFDFLLGELARVMSPAVADAQAFVNESSWW
jgi:hypothetical protein